MLRRLPSWTTLSLLFTLIIVFSLQLSSDPIYSVRRVFATADDVTPSSLSLDPFSCVIKVLPKRKVVKSIIDFGGVGDGETSNTEMFRKALRFMETFVEKGGSQLNLPRGRWLTGSFNLTSNFTLFLEEGAVILGSQVPIHPNHSFFTF